MDYANYFFSIAVFLYIVVSAIKFVFAQMRRLTLLEYQLKFLLQETGKTYDPVAMIVPAMRKAVADGKAIVAIKLYRDATGASLREAKAAVARMVP